MLINYKQSRFLFVISLIICIAVVVRAVRPSDNPPAHHRLQFSGLGLVVGLKGTGDGKDFGVLRSVVRAQLKDAKVNDQDYRDMAVVDVTATADADRPEGSAIDDVFLSIIGPATSLEGGAMIETKLVCNSDDHLVIIVGGTLEAVKTANGKIEWYCRNAKIERLPAESGKGVNR